MKLYAVTDGYIDYLHREHPHVYSNKENARSNTRKYLGVVVEMGRYKYYVPLSSAKESDYIVKFGKKMIRKDAFLIFRIVSGTGDDRILRGTIRFANMIPVPESELILYDVNAEQDQNYKNLVLAELLYIRNNARKIEKRAATVYKKHKSQNTEDVMRYCLDYTDLERMHDEWLKLVAENTE